MKTRNLFLGMVAGLFMVACTNENDPVAENVMDNAANQQYVGVKFVMNGGESSRALGGFAFGTKEEVQVDKATFFFLNDDGMGCADPYTIQGTDLAWGDGSETGSVDKKSSIIVVIKNPIETPKSIVAVLNSPDNYTRMLSLAELKNLNGTNYAGQIGGKFVMNNSVYVENNKEVLATPITAVYSTREEAVSKASVSIPVERVLAAVEFDFADKSGSNTIILDPENAADTETTTVTVELQGWNLYATNNTSNLFKKIDVNWSMDWWNDAPNRRSYWATSVNSGLQYDVWPENIADRIYVQENTSATPTGVVVSAVLKIGETPVSLVKYRGDYYTELNFLNKIANESASTIKKYWLNSGETYTNLSAANLVLDFNTVDGDITVGSSTDPIKDYQAVVSLNDNVTELYEKSGDSYVKADLAAAKQEIMSAWTVLYWKDGKTYFWTPIEHNGAEGVGQYGIVRNHLYKLTLNSISGLGVPVTDPEQVIEPEKTPEDEEAYISAQIEILKYKTVTQTVDLNN